MTFKAKTFRFLKIYFISFLSQLPEFLIITLIIWYLKEATPSFLKGYFEIEKEQKFMEYLINSHNKLKQSLSWSNPQEMASYLSLFMTKSIESAKLVTLEKSIVLLTSFFHGVLNLTWLIFLWRFVKKGFHTYHDHKKEDRLVKHIIDELKKENLLLTKTPPQQQDK